MIFSFFSFALFSLITGLVYITWAKKDRAIAIFSLCLFAIIILVGILIGYLFLHVGEID